MNQKEIAKAVALVRPEAWAQLLATSFSSQQVQRDIVRNARSIELGHVVNEMNGLAEQMTALRDDAAHSERVTKLKLRWLQLHKRYERLKEEAPKNGKAKGT